MRNKLERSVEYVFESYTQLQIIYSMNSWNLSYLNWKKDISVTGHCLFQKNTYNMYDE